MLEDYVDLINVDDGAAGAAVTIVEKSVQYAVTTDATRPSSGWSEDFPASIADGNFLWTWTHVKYSGGEETDAYSVSRIGIDGKGIQNSTVTYSQQETNVDPDTITDWGDFPASLTDGHWLYTRTVIEYSDGKTSTSYSVSQVGTGSYYAGVAEYYAAGESADTAPTGAATAGTYVSGQDISTTWEQKRPTLSYEKPYLWNFEISSDSRGNRYVTEPRCIGNFARGIKSIEELYAISAISDVSGSGQDYPTDIESWTDEPQDAAPTKEKPYQWNKTVTTYNDGAVDIIYHISAVRGDDGDQGEGGANAVRLDLDNENDSMLYDGNGTLVSASVESTPSLYDGMTKVVSGITWSYTASGCTATQDTTTGKVTVTGMSATTATVTVKATYKGVTYTAVLSLKKLVGVDKYDLVLSANSVSVDVNNGDALDPSIIHVYVYRTAQNGTRTLVNSLTAYSLGLTISNLSTQPSYSGGATFAPSADVSQYTVTLTKGGVTLDAETIPVIRDGKTGEKGEKGDPGETGGTGAAGRDAFEVFVSPSTLVLPSDNSGTIDYSDNQVLVTAKYGGETADVTFGSVVGRLNCACAKDSSNSTATQLALRLSDIATTTKTVGDTTHTIPVTSGYAVVSVTLSYGEVTETREVTVPFAVNIDQILIDQYTTQDSIVQSVTNVKSDISTLQHDMDTNAEEIASLTTRTGTLETSYDDISATVSSHTSKITTIEGDIDTMNGDIATVGLAAADAQSTADAAQSSADAAITRVATVEGSVSSLQVQTDKISAKTSHFSYVNILSSDTAGKNDSTDTAKVITAVSTSLTFYLRKAITSGNTYRFHMAMYATVGGSYLSTVSLKQGSTTLATLVSTSTKLAKGRTAWDVEFTATKDYAKGTAMTVYIVHPSTASGDENTAYECALLYDLEQYMLDTGFDIFGHTFQVTADNFIVLNNEGVRNLFVDESGNLIVRGAVNNDTLWIDSLNEADYLLDCPLSVGTVASSRSGDVVYDKQTALANKCLDLLRAPSVVVIACDITDFLLPSALNTSGFCRTKTTYLGNGERWLTFADLRMLVGRSFTFINQGKSLLVGLGSYYTVDAGKITPNTWDTATGGGYGLLLAQGQHLTATLRLRGDYGYIWEVQGDSNTLVGDTVESLFAGENDNWDMPDGASLTLKTYMSVSGGTSTLAQVSAGRTYSYLSGSSYISGTLLLSRWKGGTIITGTANTYGLVAGSSISTPLTGGMKLRKGAKHVSIKLNHGYYPSKTGTDFYMLGVRLILWDVSGSACGTMAQSPRFNVDGNLDLMQLDLTEIFDDYSESTQYYLAMNVEAFTGSRVGRGTVSPVSFTMADLGLEITEY